MDKDDYSLIRCRLNEGSAILPIFSQIPKICLTTPYGYNKMKRASNNSVSCRTAEDSVLMCGKVFLEVL